MSEFKHTISTSPIGTVAGSPPQNISNAGSGFGNTSLTIGNTATIAIAGSTAKSIIKTGFSTLVSQTGNAQLQENIQKASKLIGYATIGLIANPYVLAGKIAVDVATQSIERAVYIQDTNLENSYIQKTRGTDTSLGGRYG